MQETWKPIKGYENRYEVSNFGNFRIINYRNTGRYKIMKKSLDSDGYEIIGLVKDGKQKIHKVHRLVANEFIPNPENKPQVNHILGIKTDNRASQLEWVTNSENVRHSFDIGLKLPVKGIKASWSKFTEEQIFDIRNRYKNGQKQRRIAEYYGAKYQTINSIVLKKSWKHI